jgi:hypothetical protein
MGWLQFWASVIKSLAWPAMVLILAAMFKNHIETLLNAISDRLAELAEVRHGRTRVIFGGKIDDPVKQIARNRRGAISGGAIGDVPKLTSREPE